MKMDAVPGITTTLWFTPTITTEEMKQKTGNPDFVYEIACDQLCGKGHYSMRGTVIVQSQADYDKWIASQQSYYVANNPSGAPAPAKPVTDSTAPKKDSVKLVSMK